MFIGQKRLFPYFILVLINKGIVAENFNSHLNSLLFLVKTKLSEIYSVTTEYAVGICMVVTE